MLVLAGLALDLPAGTARAQAALDSGAAMACFTRMVAALGGDPAGLPQARLIRDVMADRTGFVTAIDVRRVGLALAPLGGMRTRPGQAIDPAVGFTNIAGLGDAAGPRPADRPRARP